MNKPLNIIWKDICSLYTNNNDTISMLWSEIELAHTAKGRYYHTLLHVGHIVSLINSHKDHINNINALLFAAFYHDFVYDTTSNNNEKLSAETAKERLTKIGVDNDTINLCYDTIIATANHKKTTCNDTNIFLDTDLTILGQEQRVYIEYTNLIRSEYALYTDKEYVTGRLKHLKDLITRDSIYHTSIFNYKYQDKAVENIKQEIKLLKNITRTT